MQSGHDVGKRILEDLRQERCGIIGRKPGRNAILPMLAAAGVEPVTFLEWETLDHEERERGKHQLKPREKIVNVK